jgi:hypothetical protein
LKKLIPFAFLILILFKHSAGQSLWVQTGFSSTTAEHSYQEIDIMDDKIFKPGFQAGTMLEFPVNNLFSVIPGFVLQTKGHSQGAQHPVSQINWKTDYNFWYFDIPVLLNLKIPIKKSGLFIEIGPYAGIGLSGNVKYYENTNEPFNEKDKIKWGKDEDALLKRMEYGITGGAGAEINRFKFGLSYTYSMRNIFIPDDFVYKNRVLTFFVSYAVLRNTKN